MKQYVADCSLSLINRTGAHYIVRAIVEGLPEHFAAVRHWRLYSGLPGNNVVKKICGRLMMKEFELLKGSSRLAWPIPTGFTNLPVLYMDPMYVLRNDLRPRDIVLCHDVGPLTTPEFFDPTVRELYRLAYDKIRAVRPGLVFVSAASKAEYDRVVGGGARFMTVIPLFVRPNAGGGDVEPVPGLSRPFFLCVGATEKRKNIPMAVRAFNRTGLADQGHRFVICGSRGNDEEAVKAEVAKSRNVLHLYYVEDAQLRWLYANATAFVLPSLLEGFGMPALEAVSHGLLPIVSAGGALEEATGGVGLFIDPQSEESIANAMVAVLSQENPLTSQPPRAVNTVENYLRVWGEVLEA